MRTCLPLLSVSCVVAFDERVEIHERVDAIEVRLGSGDVRVEAGAGPVELEGSFGGVGGELAHRVDDGVLVIDQSCRLCGGELSLRAPARTAIRVTLGSGELTVVGMRGDLHADLGAGSVDVRDHGPGPVEVATGLGDVQLAFDAVPAGVELLLSTGDARLELPSGAYALDLHADAGRIEVSGVDDDPAGPPITVDVAVGEITIRGD